MSSAPGPTGPRSRRSSTSWAASPAEGADFVAPEARVAVFDNDGTLWCEKPMYIQLDFIVRRLGEKAAADPSLADQQPYKAAASGDLDWFGDAITKHYQGDDSDLKVLAGAVMSLHESMTVEDHAALIGEVLRRSEASHAQAALPEMHLPADGGATALPRGARLHLLHRLRRWPRLHATRHRRPSTASRPSASSAVRRA